MEMKIEPREEHKWLRQLLGEWSYESDPEAAAGEECSASGTEIVRPLGDLWVAGEASGIMGGDEEHSMIITLGYDPGKGCFVGTFIADMMTHLWIYEGQLDQSGRKLMLESQGPNMQDPTKMARYMDVIEMIDADHRTMTGHFMDEEGRWQPFMRMRYERVTADVGGEHGMKGSRRA